MIMLIKAATIGCSSRFFNQLAKSNIFEAFPVEVSGLSLFEIVEKLALLQVDLFVFSAELPCGRAFSLVKNLRVRTSAVLILLGQRKSRRFVSRVLSVSDGYCLNGATPEEVQTAFVAAHSRRIWVAPVTALSVDADIVPISALEKEKRQMVKANPLSNCELQILSLVSLGYCNHQIADELYISSATVKSHLKSIYNKLAVNNRAAAVVQALRCGVEL